MGVKGFEHDEDREDLFDEYDSFSEIDEPLFTPEKSNKKRFNAFGDGFDLDDDFGDDLNVSSRDSFIEEDDDFGDFRPSPETYRNNDPSKSGYEDFISKEILPDDPYNSKYDYNPSSPIILRSRDESRNGRIGAKNPKRVTVRKASRKPEPEPELASLPDENDVSSQFSLELSRRYDYSQAQEPEESYEEYETEKKSTKSKNNSNDHEFITKIFAFLAIIICVLGLIYFVYSQSTGDNKGTDTFWESEGPPAANIKNFSPTADSEIPVIVSKENTLDENFEPNVVKLTVFALNSDMRIIPEALEALKEMSADMKTAGVDKDLKIISAYKSYSALNREFNRQVAEKKYTGMTQAAAESATEVLYPRPGTSEMQLGTNIIFSTDETFQDYFDSTDAGKWLAENAEKYGFVLRYPLDKVNATGHQFSPFEYRFVGKDEALFMKDNNYTVEEYAEFVKQLVNAN